MADPMSDFDSQFASPAEYAKEYRLHGMQIVPAANPLAGTQWKRPLIPWKVLEENLAADEDFMVWYGPEGRFRRHLNMGMITGVLLPDGRRLFVLDMDHQKANGSVEWYAGLLDKHNHGLDLDTPTQQTGGGGVQMVFIAPNGWMPPTFKTSIGIDCRGHGGFAVLPPSMHESGNPYAWYKGMAPWELEFMEAPEWLCAALDALAKEYGRQEQIGPQEVRTASPGQPIDAFGKIIDGRDEYMAKLVWAKIVDLRRDNEFMPKEADLQDAMRAAWAQYEQAVKSRIVEPGASNAALLDREGRGATAFQAKWRYALSQWDTKVATDASRPREGHVQAHTQADGKDEDWEGSPGGNDGFDYLYPPQIRRLPDPEWLVEGLVIDKGLGFIFGPPGCGKSFLALGMALSIASNQPTWFGKQIKKSGPIVYASSEGLGDMKFRLGAWETGSGVSVETSPFALVSSTMNFMDPGDIKKMMRTLERVAEDAGENPVMIIIDTVSRVLPGADENAAKEITMFIRACDLIRERFNCTVIGVHHVAKASGSMRGSSVLEGAADFLVSVGREMGEEVGKMVATKIKSARDGWELDFELVEQPVGDLKGTTSLYAQMVTPEEAEVRVAEKMKEKGVGWPSKDICKQVLMAINDAWNNGLPWSAHYHARTSGRYAIELMAKRGINKTQAEMMISEWHMNGVLVTEEVNKSSHVKGFRVISWPV